jgi:hypothetical protein
MLTFVSSRAGAAADSFFLFIPFDHKLENKWQVQEEESLLPSPSSSSI